MHPGKSIATPAEIAKAAVFMISDTCPFMNAARLVVEGSSVCRKFGLRSEIGRPEAGAMPGSLQEDGGGAGTRGAVGRHRDRLLVTALE